MENRTWNCVKYKNKVKFLQEQTGKSYVRRFKFENVKPIIDEKFADKTDGLYLVKFGNKFAIYSALFDTLSPKFDKYVYSNDYINFVVENHNLRGKYQTVYNKYSNSFADIKSSEIVQIENSSAFKIGDIRAINSGIEFCYKVYETKNQNLFGPFGYVSNEALMGFVYVRDSLGLSSPAFLLRLNTGKKVEDKYHNDLYRAMQTNQDDESLEKMLSKTNTFTYEHLFYCIPGLKKVYLKEKRNHAQNTKVQAEPTIKRSTKPVHKTKAAKSTVVDAEFMGFQPGEE